MKTRLPIVAIAYLALSGCGVKPGDTIVNEKLESMWEEEKNIDEYHRLSMDSLLAKDGDPKKKATDDYYHKYSHLLAAGSEMRILETRQNRAKVKVMLDAQPEHTARLFGVQGKVGWIDLERIKYNKR